MSTAPHWLASVFFSFSFCSSSLLVAKLWFLVIVHGIKKRTVPPIKPVSPPLRAFSDLLEMARRSGVCLF